MVSIKTPIALAGIGISLIIIFLAISRFGIPVISTLGETLSKSTSSFGSSITDFFNSFPSSGLLSPEQEQQQIFDDQLDDKEKRANDLGLTVEELEEKALRDAILEENVDDPTKFNPDGIIGFGILSLNNGQGIPDTPENREILANFTNEKLDTGVKIDGSFFDGLSDLVTNIIKNAFGDGTPQAFAEKSPPDDNNAGSADQENRDTAPIGKEITQENIIKKEKDTTIQGRAINTIGTDQEFKTFSPDGSEVTGVIRKTKKNPNALRTDSKKNPTETASERANRVFLETEDFVDVNRGASKNRRKNFGSNTGRGLKVVTTNRGGERANADVSQKERITKAKKRAEERARLTFDSRSISNF